MRRSDDRGEVGQRDREYVEHHRHRLAVEVAAAEQRAVVEHERVVGGGVQLAADQIPRRTPSRRAPDRAPAACSAARTRPARADRRRGATRGSRCRRAGRAAARPTSPARAARARPGCARRTRPACRAAPRATSRRRRAPRPRADAHRTSASAAIAVCACVPLISVSPSLGPSTTGARPAAAEHVGGRAARVAATELALADQRQREMRERREVAARAHAPLLGHRRVEAGVQHGQQQLDQIGARPRMALGDHVGAQQHHRAHLALRQQRADAGRVAAHEVHLQLGQPVGRDGDVGELAEARGHAVDHGAALRTRSATMSRVRAHAGAGGRRQRDRGAAGATASTSPMASELPSSTTGVVMGGTSPAARRQFKGRVGSYGVPVDRYVPRL